MNTFLPCLIAAIVSASPAAAQNLFTGTWKGDIAASQLSAKPSIIALVAGKYTCSTCKPAVTVVADGAFHPVVGNPYYDEMSVVIVDPTTIKRSSRKAGKLVGESTVTVAPDGKTSSIAYSDLTAANGVPVTGTMTNERIAAGPAGSHAVSGSWRATNTGQVSDSGLVFSIALDGKVLKYTTPTGVAYTATIGGPAAPVTGDPGWTSVSVKQLGKDTLVETDFHVGKTLATYTMTVSPDGKTMTTKVNDIKFGKTSTLIATRQ
ncbi:hypothetical protein U1701_14835 [Sphingomonas sp. PB2P19]|uniref:hypothetical protein n=1 Tax=Sphingomonas rhamnosi TaxID=3096156 RepID=UPI002FCB7EA1